MHIENTMFLSFFSTTFDQNIFHSNTYVMGYAQKCIQLIFIYIICVCCLILTKIGLSWPILVKLPNIKFYKNPFGGSQVVTCG
jgi:hypothetical protein